MSKVSAEEVLKKYICKTRAIESTNWMNDDEYWEWWNHMYSDELKNSIYQAMHDYVGQSDAVELNHQDIVDAYVQGAISENFGASEQEINIMVANANIYWNNHFGMKQYLSRLEDNKI